jgi:hypothetical protein
MRYVPRRNREGLNVVELCSGAERTNGGPPCAATVGAYEQMVVCTENSVLIDYVTESPNVSGDDLRTSRVAIDKKIAATGPRCDQVRRARSLTRGHGAPQQRGGNLRVKSPARTARVIPP